MKMLLHQRKVFSTALIAVWSIITLFPLIWMAYSSFKTNKEIVRSTFSLPTSIQFDNYFNAWNGIANNATIGRYLINSMVVTVLAVAIIVPVVFLAGYSLGRYDFKGKNLVSSFLIVIIAVPVQAVIISLYNLMNSLSLTNTHIGLAFAYAATNVAFMSILLSSFFRTFPSEIEEAATIDGCNEASKLIHVVLPLSMPAVATVVIIMVINVWNELLFAIVILQKTQLKTLTQGLISFMDDGGIDFAQTFAALTISTIPILVFFLVFQKQIIAAMTDGAVKG